MTDEIPDVNRRLAEYLNDAGVVVEATPHSRGVYLWTTGNGYGFGAEIRKAFDFRLADVFTMDVLQQSHRHYRDDAAIFLNLVTHESYLSEEA